MLLSTAAQVFTHYGPSLFTLRVFFTFPHGKTPCRITEISTQSGIECLIIQIWYWSIYSTVYGGVPLEEISVKCSGICLVITLFASANVVKFCVQVGCCNNVVLYFWLYNKYFWRLNIWRDRMRTLLHIILNSFCPLWVLVLLFFYLWVKHDGSDSKYQEDRISGNCFNNSLVFHFINFTVVLVFELLAFLLSKYSDSKFN